MQGELSIVGNTYFIGLDLRFRGQERVSDNFLQIILGFAKEPWRAKAISQNGPIFLIRTSSVSCLTLFVTFSCVWDLPRSDKRCLNLNTPSDEMVGRAEAIYVSSLMFVWARALTAALMCSGSSGQTSISLANSVCFCTICAKQDAKTVSSVDVSALAGVPCGFAASDFESEGWRFESSRARFCKYFLLRGLHFRESVCLLISTPTNAHRCHFGVSFPELRPKCYSTVGVQTAGLPASLPSSTASSSSCLNVPQAAEPPV